MTRRSAAAAVPILTTALAFVVPSVGASAQVGAEKALDQHLADGEEYQVSAKKLLKHGAKVFSARFTGQDGAGRPFTKGTGGALSDAGSPLEFPRNFNRVSAPDANSCAGCHNVPRVGGGGEFVTNVFVLGQRFDFATFDAADAVPTRGTADENGAATTLQTIANSRNTLGMFGAGYVEMLARQITVELQRIRDEIPLDGSAPLVAYGSTTARSRATPTTAGTRRGSTDCRRRAWRPPSGRRRAW